MSETINVADYIVKRLAEEGIAHCFGVAGDYLFPICDAVERSSKVKWTGCANELNAAYAADGYARVRGAAMLATTYGVGELSALNGVMGERPSIRWFSTSSACPPINISVWARSLIIRSVTGSSAISSKYRPRQLAATPSSTPKIAYSKWSV